MIKKMEFNPERRKFGEILTGGLLFTIGGSGIITNRAGAHGKKDFPQGIRDMRGEVKINGSPVEQGFTVSPGDTVTTGKGGMVIFVHEQSVYRIGGNTRFTLTTENDGGGTKSILKIARGKVLSVFRGGRKQVRTPTAVIGVRGSGIYAEAEPERTYFCTCYGISEISARGGGERETVKAKHHDQPRFIHAPGSGKRIVKAPMLNHTDKDLIFIESLAGRKPPFWDPFDYNSDGY